MKAQGLKAIAARPISDRFRDRVQLPPVTQKYQMNLRQTGTHWEFKSEADLEEIIWRNLKSLFGFNPLRQQHCVQGQYCDILATDVNQQLVVIELKNTEDRYVVQQVTRYYHALIEEHPFEGKVDYNQPIRLVVIAPTFHRDNQIDRQYNLLNIEFLQFHIVVEESQLLLRLENVDNQKSWNLPLTHLSQHQEVSTYQIPAPPKKLLNRLANASTTTAQNVLEIRRLLLSFDERMQEISLSNGLRYGRGKTRPCAEFLSKKTGSRLTLFLWLPHPIRRQICRMYIETQEWETITTINYCSRSFVLSEAGVAYWQDPKTLSRRLVESGSKYPYDLLHYRKLIENPDRIDQVSLFVEIALEKWREKHV